MKKFSIFHFSRLLRNPAAAGSFAINTGFTLIELILMITIMLTISVLSTSFYARFFNQNAIDNTTDQIIGSLRKAQLYSMMGKQNGVWGVSYSSTDRKIRLFLTGNPAFDETFTVNSNITVNGLNAPITFEKASGMSSIATTIVVSEGSKNKSIVVSSQGVVSR